MRLYFIILASLLLSADGQAAEPSSSGGSGTIVWRPWSDSVFRDAAREHKFVLLDLEAVWCHWCHVMDGQTYADPRVIALIHSRYIAVRVDQDSRPDLSNRYEDYGWPATVVFNADRGEIVKRRGYLPPAQMVSMLQAIIDDPTPGPSVTNAPAPRVAGDVFQDDAGFQELEKQFADGYDWKLVGWSVGHKFLDWDNTEYAMKRSRRGDAAATAMARQTLDAQLKLIDPVWGGVDQYSIDDWDHPHFEKLIQIQAEDMQIYAEAYSLWKDPVYLKAALRIHAYVRAFLTSPDGVVYTSQDADVHPGQPPEPYYRLDDAARRRVGMPRIDTSIYARENGWLIQALVALHAATGDALYRDEAVRASDWIVAHQSVPGGGFRHGDEAPRLYLGDTLAMGRAFLALYSATCEPAWLKRAQQAAVFIRGHFANAGDPMPVGFATAAPGAAHDVFQPAPEFDENVSLARFANLLFHSTHDPADQAMAKRALRYAAAPDIAHARHAYVGGLLLAGTELKTEPLHIVVIGSRKDPAAQKLAAAALSYPDAYKQMEWYDPSEAAPALNLYPHLSQAAAFVCTQRSCSSPIYDAPHLLAFLIYSDVTIAL